jgi:capsular polysaccharide biosynthesis protein
MEFIEVIKIIRSRKLVVLAIVGCAVLAAVATRLATRSAPKGAATVQILVDSPSSALANLVQNTTPLTARAAVFAQVMASEAVIEEIGKAAAIPAHEITAEGPYSGPGQKLDVVTPSEARGNQLLAQSLPYKLTFVAQENEPVVTASVQAPTATAAARLANGIYPGTVAYVASLQKSMNTPSSQRVTIRELGPPQAGTVNSSAGLSVAVAAALGVLLLGGLILIGFEGARRQALASEARESADRALAGNANGNGNASGSGSGKAKANANGNGATKPAARPAVTAPRPPQRQPDRPVALPVGERD